MNDNEYNKIGVSMEDIGNSEFEPVEEKKVSKKKNSKKKTKKNQEIIDNVDVSNETSDWAWAEKQDDYYAKTESRLKEDSIDTIDQCLDTIEEYLDTAEGKEFATGFVDDVEQNYEQQYQERLLKYQNKVFTSAVVNSIFVALLPFFWYFMYIVSMDVVLSSVIAASFISGYLMMWKMYLSKYLD